METNASTSTGDVDPRSAAEIPPDSNSSITGGEAIIICRKKKKKKIKPQNDDAAPSSSSSSSSSHSIQRGVRALGTRRIPRVLIGSVRHKESDVDALALPLGMSMAAVISQVLERKDVAGERMSADHLSTMAAITQLVNFSAVDHPSVAPFADLICTLAVRESLANIFGNKFDCFVGSFEKSFRSTLTTLRLINESSKDGGERLVYLNKRSSCCDPNSCVSHSRDSKRNSGVTDSQPKVTSRERFSTHEEIEENMPTEVITRELAIYDKQTNQQLACVSPNARKSLTNQIMFNTLEKSVMEQARSNDLKTFEIGLTMRKLQLKETQLALDSTSNLLERFKLSMGISRASLKAEKFKSQLEDTRYAELLRKCIDCLVAGLFIMLTSLAYGTYTYSPQRITEATASCKPVDEPKSWWIPKPMSSFNSGFHILRCQVQVLSRMLFGVSMILVIAYLLLQRSATSKQTMPITFILLLLGGACGFVGKFCIDTLGGSGYHWLFYWEALCLLHFFANIFTSVLFSILYGPVNVSGRSKCNTMCPYWIRQIVFYGSVLLLLPVLCGLMPFAGPLEWKEHFSSLLIGRKEDHFSSVYGDSMGEY
ncbi:hypothetical protein RJ639_004147 [Escallonia herrerae]|uniref:Protein CPR-5 n=1 Tax=Escallonia herrerae TaxID=1293975 RepID=A0AA88W4X1_9ASTE|nr:hypothetical protein RJ639_004147 [Escallonia herrerae]